MTEPNPKGTRTNGLWIVLIAAVILAFIVWMAFGSERMEGELTTMEEMVQEQPVIPDDNGLTEANSTSEEAPAAPPAD